MSNSFGKRWVVTTFGESHGLAIGAIIDGCPPRMPLSESDIQPQLDRRRPGQKRLTSARMEPDTVAILSGLENGLTLGAPIALEIRNRDIRAGDYAAAQSAPRPSHADWTYRAKYGIQASSGGGRASARETAARVAAGAVAERFLSLAHAIDIAAWVSSIGAADAPDMTAHPPTRAQVDASPTRCPDPAAAAQMAEIVEAALKDGDSAGSAITCVCRNVPPGLGEPVFDKLHAMLAHAMLSIPACRGFEVGAGFNAVRMRGSEHNDVFTWKGGRLGTVGNRSGGVQGGISNGEDIVFRVAFKPTPSIAKEQVTADYEGKTGRLAIKGRHDPCVGIRAVPVVEAMAALVLADAILLAGIPPARGF